MTLANRLDNHGRAPIFRSHFPRPHRCPQGVGAGAHLQRRALSRGVPRLAGCSVLHRFRGPVHRNDGSTDGSLAIIHRYMEADARFRVIDKPNSGYGASMNMGLANAIGEHIAILESDDFFEPNALELLVDVAECNQSDVVKGDFYLYWSHRKSAMSCSASSTNRRWGARYAPSTTSRSSSASPRSGRPSIARAFSRATGSLPRDAGCLLSRRGIQFQGLGIRRARDLHCRSDSSLPPGQREVIGQLGGKGLLRL